jgi:hypothetical protein
MPGMKASTRDQTHGICFGVVGHPLVDCRTETDYFRRHVIDQDGPVHSGSVQILKKSFGRMTEFGDLIEIRPFSFYKLQGRRLEHLQRLDVDVAVGDQLIFRGWAVPRTLSNVPYYLQVKKGSPYKGAATGNDRCERRNAADVRTIDEGIRRIERHPLRRQGKDHRMRTWNLKHVGQPEHIAGPGSFDRLLTSPALQ